MRSAQGHAWKTHGGEGVVQQTDDDKRKRGEWRTKEKVIPWQERREEGGVLGGERERRVAIGTKGNGVKTTENNIASLIGAGRMTMVKKGKQRKER